MLLNRTTRGYGPRWRHASCRPLSARDLVSCQAANRSTVATSSLSLRSPMACTLLSLPCSIAILNGHASRQITQASSLLQSRGALRTLRAIAQGHAALSSPSASLGQLWSTWEEQGQEAFLKLVEGRNVWEASVVLLSAIKRRNAIPQQPNPPPDNCEAPSPQDACDCLVELCQYFSLQDLGTGGLLKQLLDSFQRGATVESETAAAPSLPPEDQNLLMNTAMRMVEAVPKDSNPTDTKALQAVFRVLGSAARSSPAALSGAAGGWTVLSQGPADAVLPKRQAVSAGAASELGKAKELRRTLAAIAEDVKRQEAKADSQSQMLRNHEAQLQQLKECVKHQGELLLTVTADQVTPPVPKPKAQSPKAADPDKLLGQLMSGLPALKEQAAQSLCALAENSDLRASITDAGAIPLLVQALASSSVALQQAAVKTLWHLATTDDNRESIASAGAGSLVKLLESESAVVQEYSAKTIRRAAVDDDNKIIFASAGAIPHLVNLLESDSAAVQQNSAKALNILAMNDDNKVSIAAAGAILPLTRLLYSDSPALMSVACKLLTKLRIADSKESICSGGRRLD